jgi:cyclopropane fatty-acyl-phospholipid synthase-like methyltransferase
MSKAREGEAQYGSAIDFVRRQGLQRMGLHASWAWHDDPKRMAFSLARYKFVAKMLDGAREVLEVGCADGFASRIVAQAVGRLTAVDFDPEFVASARETAAGGRWPIEFRQHDLLGGPVEGRFDAMYSLDVLEHIPAEHEVRFLTNMIAPLAADGVCLIGMPSLQSQQYASPLSKEGHVNCKDQKDLRALLQRFFANVFLFSMNDEIVHTGFAAMSHYNIGLCCGRKPAPAVS